MTGPTAPGGVGRTPRQRQVMSVGGHYLQAGPLAIAHRGGAAYENNDGNENTLQAMRRAIDLGYRYLETDLRLSADGEVFCFHDPDVARMVGEPRLFAELSAADVRALRTVGGEPIPTLAQVLEEFPTARLNLDVKSDAVVAPAIEVLQRAQAFDRSMMCSFDHRRLAAVRRRVPQAATSASRREALSLWSAAPGAAGSAARGGALAVQVPRTYRGRNVVTRRFIWRAHARGMQVHVWTIDDADQMRELLDLGVDGIMTDRPDVLKDVLIERGQWHLPA